MLNRFLVLSALCVSIVASTCASSRADLVINLTKGATPQISFSGFGQFAQTVGSTISFDFGPALIGAASGNINPTFALTGIAPGFNFYQSNISELSLTGGKIVLFGTSPFNAGDGYVASSGLFSLTGMDTSGFNSIANGQYVALGTPDASSFGGVTLNVSAVPEPASMIYGSIMAGSAGLAYMRRRKSKLVNANEEVV